MLDQQKKLRLQSKLFNLFNTKDGQEVIKLLKDDNFTSHLEYTEKEILIDEGRRRLIKWFEDIINAKGE